jgi:hypothetical protein
MTSADNREHCRTIGRIGSTLLRRSIYALIGNGGLYEGSTG